MRRLSESEKLEVWDRLDPRRRRLPAARRDHLAEGQGCVRLDSVGDLAINPVLRLDAEPHPYDDG